MARPERHCRVRHDHCERNWAFMCVRSAPCAERCHEIFHEKASGKSRKSRPQLERAIDELGTGDLMVVICHKDVEVDPRPGVSSSGSPPRLSAYLPCPCSWLTCPLRAATSTLGLLTRSMIPCHRTCCGWHGPIRQMTNKLKICGFRATRPTDAFNRSLVYLASRAIKCVIKPTRIHERRHHVNIH